MNWDRISGNWKQATGRVMQRWGKLTDDDLTAVAGNRDVLTGKIQERYGVLEDEAERQVSIWETKVSRAWDSLDGAIDRKSKR